MAKVFTIGNHKGGVGKTTSTINLGAAFVQLGKRVLLVDLDPQANLTVSLGVKDPSTTVYHYLRGEKGITPLKIKEKLALLPANLDLSAAEIELSAETGREYILGERLSEISKDYDYIVLDSPPALGLLTLNALAASDFVFIPLQAEYLAMQGLSKYIEVIQKVQHRINRGLRIGGVFITQYDGRKVLNRNVLESLQDFFKDRLFETKIRDNIALAEAPTSGLDIFSYQPKCHGALDYLSLAQEVLSRWA